jgi:uncharacterized delta-60 repeat protein
MVKRATCLLSILGVIFLTACNAKLALLQSSQVTQVPQYSIAFGAVTTQTLTSTTLQLELPFSGDDNQNSTVTFYFCSIKVQVGCDPLAGNAVTLTRGNQKYQALIDLSLTPVTPGDLLRFKFQSTDGDGLSGGSDQGFFIIPHATTSPRMITQFGFITFNQPFSSGGMETVSAIKRTSDGSLFVAGSTTASLGEPPAGGSDLFVAKFTSSGVLDATFGNGRGLLQLGAISLGSRGSGEDYLRAFDVDTNGNLYLAGDTSGNLGDTNGGASDLFVVKVLPSGLLDSTFGGGDGVAQLGLSLGAASGAPDELYDIELDASGNVYIAALTMGNLGEVNAGGKDLVLVKLTNLGTLDTSFGGGDGIIQLGSVTVGAGRASGWENVGALFRDTTTGALFVSGSTASSLGEANAGGNDFYVAKFTSSGAIDLTFGGGDGVTQLGSVSVGANAAGSENEAKLAVNSSGEIFVAGVCSGNLGEANGGGNDFVVFKLTPAGDLDLTFGGGDGITQLGSVTLPTGSTPAQSVGNVFIQSDSKLILAGSSLGAFAEANIDPTKEDLVLVRFNADGTLDTTFGTSGVKQLGNPTVGARSNGAEDVSDVVRDNLGNYYVAGITTGSLGEVVGGGNDVFVAQFDSNGALINSFGGGDGIAQLGAVSIGQGPSGDEFVGAMAYDATGNMYLAGSTNGSLGEASFNTYSWGTDIFVMKIDDSGNLDASFGLNGIRRLGTTSLGSLAANDDWVWDIAIDSSENIYLLGDGLGAAGFFVAKLTSTGAFDTTFHSDGINHFGASVSIWELDKIRVDSSGAVYVAGVTQGHFGETNGGSSSNDAFVAKITAAGILDTTFGGGDGVIQLGSTSLGASRARGRETVNDLIINSAGELFLTGTTWRWAGSGGTLGDSNTNSEDVYIAKFSSSGALDLTFGGGDGIAQLGGSLGARANGNDAPRNIHFGPSGTLLVSGVTTGALGEANAGVADIFVAKFTSAGVLDTTFGGGDGVAQLGSVTIGSNANQADFAYGSFYDSVRAEIFVYGATLGSLAEAKGSLSPSHYDTFVAKFTSTGALDTSFNSDGLAQLGSVTGGSAASFSESPSGFMVHPTSGHLYFVGSIDGAFGEFVSSGYDIYLIHLDQNGEAP